MFKKHGLPGQKPRVVIFRANPIDPDPRVEKIAFSLSKVYSVHVVGWDRTGTLKTPQEKPHFLLELYRRPSPFGTGIKNLYHLLGWQVFLISWVLRFGRSYQVIHACDFDTVLPALIGKFLFGCKTIYDIFDFYADHVRNTPDWVRLFIKWLDLKIVRLVDAVILVTEAQLSQLESVKPRRLVIVYNTPIDAQASTIVPKDPSMAFHVAYIGILQVERGLLEMLDVIQNHPDWHFDLAGFGGDEAIIYNRAREIQNVTWYGRVPYSKALEISQTANVLFSTCNPVVPNYQHASANKLFEAMMLAKPIIVARGTHMDQLVEKYHCGLVVPYGDILALNESLELLESNNDFRISLGQNGRMTYEKCYSWVKMEKRLLDLYMQLI